MKTIILPMMLILIIMNLVLMSFLAFLGKKNWLMLSAFLETALAIYFALLMSS